VPILLTFSPFGSTKTMEFMKWLGIAFLRWLENELRPAPDPLQSSLLLRRQILARGQAYARGKGIPISMNVDTVQYADGTTTTAKLNPNWVQHVEARRPSRVLICLCNRPGIFIRQGPQAQFQIGKRPSSRNHSCGSIDSGHQGMRLSLGY
jgi:hypothetical protein